MNDDVTRGVSCCTQLIHSTLSKLKLLDIVNIGDACLYQYFYFYASLFKRSRTESYVVMLGCTRSQYL